jgi:hypothetical protein
MNENVLTLHLIQSIYEGVVPQQELGFLYFVWQWTKNRL